MATARDKNAISSVIAKLHAISILNRDFSPILKVNIVYLKELEDIINYVKHADRENLDEHLKNIHDFLNLE